MRLFAACVALLFAGVALAAEYTGSIKKVNADSIEVEIDGVTKTLKLKKTGDKIVTKVNLKGKKGGEPTDTFEKLLGRKIGKKGLNARIKTEGTGADEVVTEIQGGKKKKAAE